MINQLGPGAGWGWGVGGGMGSWRDRVRATIPLQPSHAAARTHTHTRTCTHTRSSQPPTSVSASDLCDSSHYVVPSSPPYLPSSPTAARCTGMHALTPAHRPAPRRALLSQQPPTPRPVTLPPFPLWAAHTQTCPCAHSRSKAPLRCVGSSLPTPPPRQGSDG